MLKAIKDLKMERQSKFMDWKTMLLRWQYLPNVLQIQFLRKFQLPFCAEIEKHTLKFTRTHKAPRTARTILKRTNLDFKFYKATLIKTVCFQQKGRRAYQWTRTEITQRKLYSRGQLNFNKGPTKILWGSKPQWETH